MKKIITSVLVISFIVAIPGDLAAREKRGVELRIIKTNDQIIMGYLVAVKAKQKSLLLIEKFKETDVTVNIHDIEVIIFSQRSNGLKGLAIGFGFGAFIGFTAIPPDDIITKWEGALTGGAFLGGIGAGIGALAGIGRKIKIEGKSEAEIEDIMEILRKKARMPDYN